MKLEEANDIYSNKRKWEFDHIDRKAVSNRDGILSFVFGIKCI